MRTTLIPILAAVTLASPVFAETVAFPTEETFLPRHCLAVANSAIAVGMQYTANPKAVPLAKPGEKLYEDLVASGAFSRTDLQAMQADRETQANEARGFLVRAGIPSNTRNPTNEALDEISSHVAQCDAWLARRPPTLPALPPEGAARIDQCIAAAVAAQSLGNFTGNRSGQTGAMATRAARNGREMLTEMQSTGIIKAQANRERLKPPDGDLYVQAMDMVLGLKLARPGPIENVDVRSVRLLDERIRACHKAFGLQMPLQ